MDINGTSYTVSSDIAMSGLTAAPSSNNTALVNDTNISSDFFAGESDAKIPYITIDTVGSEISGLVGQWITLKTSTEYMFGYLESSTKLTNVFRGFFFDSSGNPLKRVALSNNDTLTLMKTGWTFIDDDGATQETVYNTPVWSFTSPSSPGTGDYWYDQANQTWKRYSGSSFEIIGRTLIGLVVMDTTDCVASRSFDQYFNPKDSNVENFELEIQSTEIIRTKRQNNRLYIYGNEFQFLYSSMTWNITTDLDTGITEANSTTYYLYVKQNGDTVISDIKPYYRDDMNAKYHPYNSWLYVGLFYNDSSGDIEYVFDEIRNYKSKFQHKYLTADVTSNNSDIADLKFSNLIIGHVYRVTGSVFLQAGTSAGSVANISIYNNSVKVAGATITRSGTSNPEGVCGVSAIFTAAATTLVSQFAELTDGTLRGDGTSGETYLTIEDITNSHTLVTIFS